MRASEPIRPSEVAQGFAEIIPALSTESVVELRTLLTHHLGVESAAAARWKQLRLLVLLLQRDTGEVPSVATYTAAREQEIAADRYAPTASALIDDYGTFPRAVRAAIRFAFQGSAARVPRNYKHCRPHPSSTPRQALIAIRRAYHMYSAWPTEWEYGEWAQLDRDLRRAAGTEGKLPGTPGLAQIRDLFDDYATALAEAQAMEHGQR